MKKQKTENSLLLDVRSVAGTLAYMRDGGNCQYHKWVMNNAGVMASETHHVLGRGGQNDMAREHWILRLSLCQECHHKRHHQGGYDRKQELVALHHANRWPEQPIAPNTQEIACLGHAGVLGVLMDTAIKARDMLVSSLEASGGA